jgi:hypothetical protein
MDPRYLISDEARYECVWGLPYDGFNDRQFKTRLKGKTAMDHQKRSIPCGMKEKRRKKGDGESKSR